MTIKHRRWCQDHPAGCQIRLPGVCVWTPTVGSHIRSGIRFGKGVAIKPSAGANDLLLTLACSVCHDIYDKRVVSHFDQDFVDKCWFEGLCATLLLREQEDML